MAQKQGYPARSVYKLQELQQRFRLIKPGTRILDIGASPGSWSQFCLELLKGKGKLVSVDLSTLIIPEKENFTFIQGDLFTREIYEHCLLLGPYDLILSDAAPSTSGNRTVDSQASLEIGTRVLQIASAGLIQGGNLVIKVFQGGDEGSLLQQLRQRFKKTRAFKPQASKKASKETFFLGFSLK